MAPANGLPKKLGEGTAPDTPGSSPRHADYTEGRDSTAETSLSVAGALRNLLPTHSAVRCMPQAWP